MKPELAQCILLAEVLAADGIMAAPEKAFLAQAMERYKLDEAERSKVFGMKSTDAALEVVRGLDGDAQQALLDQLANATLVDGQLSPLELAAVKRLSERIRGEG